MENIHNDKLKENNSKAVANQSSTSDSGTEQISPPAFQLKFKGLPDKEAAQGQDEKVSQLQYTGGIFPNSGDDGDENPGQLKSRSSGDVSEPFQLKEKPNKTGLPDNLKAGVENLSGFSMDDVKVHYNSDKPAQLNAHAYAQGSDIHLASGQERHLPHEAWHVVQQKQGRVEPTKQMKGKVPVNDDAGLEKEADEMGAKAIKLNSFSNMVQKKSVPAKKSPVQRVQGAKNEENRRWGVDSQFGKKLMNANDGEIYDRLINKLNKYLEAKSDSFEHFEKIAEMLSMIIVRTETTETAIKNHVLPKIKALYSKNYFRQYYLESILINSNGSDFGEPSKLSQLLLLSGLLNPSFFAARDHKEVIKILEDASSEELVEIQQNQQIYNVFLDYLKKSNYTTTETNFTVSVDEYLKLIIKNKTRNTQGVQTEEEQNEALRDKKQEAVAMLRMLLASNKVKDKGKHLKSLENSVHIRMWASKLAPHERQAISVQDNTNEVYNFLENEQKIKANYLKYIMGLFNTQAYDKEDAAQSDAYHDQESSMFLNYLKSKEEGGSKKWKKLPEKVEALDPATKLKILHKFYSSGSLATSLEGREVALTALTAELARLNVPRDIISRVIMAFRWGATDGASSKDSTVGKIMKLAFTKVLLVTHRGLKMLELVMQLQADEYMQIRENKELVRKLNQFRNSASGDDRNPWDALFSQLKLPQRLDQADIAQGEEHANQKTKDLIEFDPSYWGYKLQYESYWVLGGASRNDMLSIITNACAAGERAKAAGKFNSVKDFTNEVLNYVGKNALKKLKKNEHLKAGFDALESGTAVPAEARMKAATFSKASLKRIRGFGMKPSAIIKAVNDASGVDLLMDWSDYPQFMESVVSKDISDEEKKLEILTYIPDLRREFLDKLQAELPRAEFASIHQKVLFKMAGAIENDTKFKKWLTISGVTALPLRATMMKSLGLLNREKLIDTGWQLKYFSTKGPARKEAKRILLHRLRKANKQVVKAQPDGDALDKAHEKLVEGTELYERRAATFENVKEVTIEIVMLTISILIGIATTMATLGTAAPLMAAGVAPFAAQLITSLGFTLAASTIKQLVTKALVGAAHNDKEAFFNVVKDVLMSGATVAAGHASGAMMDAIKGSGSAFGNWVTTMETSNPSGYAFFEKFFSVSPLEVAFRRAMDLGLENATTAESSDRQGIGLNEALRYLRDTAIDGFLKGVFDHLTSVNGTGIADATNFGVDTSGAPIEYAPDLGRLQPHEVLLVVLGENILTSQNYSVAEQDSVVGALVDKLIDKVPTIFTEVEASEHQATEGSQSISKEEGIRYFKRNDKLNAYFQTINIASFPLDIKIRAITEIKESIGLKGLVSLGFPFGMLVKAIQPAEWYAYYREDSEFFKTIGRNIYLALAEADRPALLNAFDGAADKNEIFGLNPLRRAQRIDVPNGDEDLNNSMRLIEIEEEEEDDDSAMDNSLRPIPDDPLENSMRLIEIEEEEEEDSALDDSLQRSSSGERQQGNGPILA